MRQFLLEKLYWQFLAMDRVLRNFKSDLVPVVLKL